MLKIKIKDAFISIKNGANIKQDKSSGGIPITRIETIVDNKIDIELVTLAEIANCIALNKPLEKTLRTEFVRVLKLASDRAVFYQDGDLDQRDFDYEQARNKVRDFILNLDYETKQQFKVNLGDIWLDGLIHSFSSVLGINSSEIATNIINNERILANNKFPNQGANTFEWGSFKRGLKKDILGLSSLLYDMDLTDNQKENLVDYLKATILLARCLRVSETVDLGKFENSLVSLEIDNKTDT